MSQAEEEAMLEDDHEEDWMGTGVPKANRLWVGDIAVMVYTTAAMMQLTLETWQQGWPLWAELSATFLVHIPAGCLVLGAVWKGNK